MTIFAHSFNYYALRYFLQWEQVEKSLHQSFSVDLTTDAVRSAMHHFRISRSFPDVSDPRKAKLVVNAINSARTGNPVENVDLLTRKFKKDFKSYNLSAASKLLWCRDRSPYLVFDSRAVKTLKKLGRKFNSRSYESYETAWRAAYSDHEKEIAASARGLPDLQPFFAHWHSTKNSIRQVARERWFRERVFDLALWENGSDS